MPTNLNPIRCKSCARVLVTVSSDGIVPTAFTGGCEVCKQFRPLYDAMQTADEHYATYKDRRDDYSPKRDAFALLKMTNLAFNNWLLNVEAIGEDAQDPLPNTEQEADSATLEEESTKRGTKRVRSLSPTTGHPSITDTDAKGRRNKKVLPMRKRLKFSDAVKFREDYRTCSEFLRSDEAYVPGRYALPEGSEYLDTSGSAKTAVKFLGMKKVGKVWVEVDTEDDDRKSKKKGRRKNVVAETARGDGEDVSTNAEGEAMPHEDAPEDARAQRLARRKSSAPAANSTQKHIAVRPKSGRANVKTLSQTEDKARQPLGTSSAVIRDGAGAVVQHKEAAVEDENNEKDASDSLIHATNMARDVQPSLQTDGSVPESNGSKNSSDLVNASAGYESVSHNDLTDQQLHTPLEQLSRQEVSTREDQGPSDKERDIAASKFPCGRVETGVSKDEPASEVAEDVDVELGSTTVNRLDPTASKDTSKSSPRDDATELNLRNNADSGAGDTLALWADHQTPDTTLHNSTALPSIKKKDPRASKLELQDGPSAPSSGDPGSPLPTPSPDAPLNDTIVLGHAANACYAQHPTSDPVLRLPAASVVLEANLDGSG